LSSAACTPDTWLRHEKGGLERQIWDQPEMPGVSTRWVMERWKLESGTCLRISQRRVLSGETRGLAQSEVRDSNMDLFIYSLSSRLTPHRNKANLLKRVLSSEETLLTEILTSALLFLFIYLHSRTVGF